MELSFSKFKFLLVVSCAILQMPRGSEARPMFNENRNQCGKFSVRDATRPRDQVVRELPWVVIVRADVGYVSRTCTGTILTPRLVLTSKYCAPKESKNIRYIIEWRLGRQKPVAAVHTIEGTPFIALEVSSPPFRSAFTICLPFELATGTLNNTVWSVTSVSRASSYPSFDIGFLRQEHWLIVKSCEHACDPHTDRCTCAQSAVDSSLCAEDEGKPVVRWIENRWYLVGMVTNVKVEKGKCKETGRQRVFETITEGDALKIGKLIASDMSYYLPDVKPDTDSQLQRPRCGREDKLELGPEKTLAPFLLPGVVAIHATSGSRTVNCAGVLVRVRLVLTAKDCVPKGFENAQYKVTHNSLDISTGFDIKVEKILDPKPFGSSFVLLQLETQVIEEVTACLLMRQSEIPGEHVVAASWAFNDAGGKFAKNKLYYEDWTLPKNPEICEDDEMFVEERHNNSLILCAVSASETHHACQGDLGQPVMRWHSGNWYLIGMVIHVDVGQKDCEPRKSRKRIFEWLKRDLSPRG